MWPILDRIFDLNLLYENSEEAVAQRKNFLSEKKIGICDIVASTKRDKIDASDLGMKEVILRDLVKYLVSYPNINTLLFTGGNSKNGPEYFFRKLLKIYGINFYEQTGEIPRIHNFTLPKKPEKVNGSNTISVENKILFPEREAFRTTKPRMIRTVSLIAPSGAANRAVGSLNNFKAMKKENPEITTIDFRVMQYSKYF